MRCEIEFTGEKQRYDTEKDHYKAMIQFLKHVFANTRFYEELYGKKGFKPFASCIKFSGMKKLLGRMHLSVKTPMRILFSTDNNVIFQAFVDSLYNTDYAYEINAEETLSISNITCKTDRHVNVRKIKAKTISPVVVKKMHAGFLNHNQYYMMPGDSGFMKNLNEYTQKRIRYLTGKESGNVSIEPINVRSCNIPFYSGYVKCFRGSFYLHGTPETLKFVLNNGLGVKTGAGFGMIDYLI